MAGFNTFHTIIFNN